MKLIIFLIIIVIIYYLATKIKVVHIDNLPPNNRKELVTRKKIKDVLASSYVKDTSREERMENFVNNLQFDKPKNLPKNLPDAHKLVGIIRSEFVDSQYKFNIPNLPQSTRYCTKYTKKLDDKYLEQIKKNINDWNEIFNHEDVILIKGMNPIFVIETGAEFVIKVNVSLLYADKTMHLETEYYGQIEKCDDFLNGGVDSYIIQLVSIKPIKKSEYDINPTPADIEDINNPFMSMDEQLNYVNKIKKMHYDENNMSMDEQLNYVNKIKKMHYDENND